MRMVVWAALVGAVLVAPTMPVVAGTITSTLDQSDPSAGIGAAPYGVVTLSQDGADAVQVTVTLDDPTAFVDTGGPHHAFAFSLDVPLTSVTISGLTSGFTNLGAGVTSTPFGTFTDGIDCPSCGPGASNALPGPLTFIITDPSGLTTADFIANGDGYFFAADVIGPADGTGSVASDTETPVPEPASLALLTAALVGMGLIVLLRRRAPRVG